MFGVDITPKHPESQANIQRPLPLRSRFFHAERPSMKPWIDENKENDISYSLKEKDHGKTDEKKCFRCYEKAGFILEPCNHS